MPDWRAKWADVPRDLADAVRASRAETIPLRRQPAWGRITVTIVVNTAPIRRSDGHARAERREEAWYRS